MTKANDEFKTFTLYWMNGKKTQIYGESFNHAAATAGIGVQNIPGLAFHREGDDRSHSWNFMTKDWELDDLSCMGYDT